MKVFLVALSIFLVCFGFTLYQSDFDTMFLTSVETKYEATSLANAMALYYDTEQYGEGLMVLNDTEIMNFAKAQINTSLYHYEISVIDDLGTIRYYKDGVLASTNSASFPYSYKDSSEYQVTIIKPSVIVTLTRPGEYFKGINNDFKEIVRTSSYVVQPREN